MLHYRRCVLNEATHVAVAVFKTEGDNSLEYDSGHLRTFRRFFDAFSRCIYALMSFIFSDALAFGCFRGSNGIYVLRPVERGLDGSKYFVFMFRRYNLDGDKFVPGHWNTGKYVEDILAADTSEGLSSEEVEVRRRIVGPNKIEMEKPTFWKTMKEEFSKPFYTYQSFMIWSVS